MRDYEHEILELLKSNGNCVDGFNNIQKWGNFHPNTLVKYLKIMKKKGLIEVTEVNKQRKRYCIPNNNFDWSGNNFYDIFNLLNRDHNRTSITEKEKNFLKGAIMRLAFQTVSNVEVLLLYEKYVNHDKKNREEINQFKKKLWAQIDSCLKELPVNDRLKVLTSLIVQPSKPLGLNEYRKLSHPMPE